jgi:hypothetical protein
MSLFECFCNAQSTTKTINREVLLFENKVKEDIITNDEYIDLSNYSDFDSSGLSFSESDNNHNNSHMNESNCLTLLSSVLNFKYKNYSMHSMQTESGFLSSKLNIKLKKMRKFLIDISF